MTEEIVAVGGNVTAKSLLSGYMAGAFPMWVDVAEDSAGVTEEVLAWFSPDPRAVLTHPGTVPSRSLRRSMRGFDITVDRHFDEVLAGCADPRRPHGWITEDYQQAYRELHRAGFAHSIDVLQQGVVVGGLLGVHIGGLFCAESKFHREPDASKAAVVGLSRVMFGDDFASQRLIDAQWLTPHLESLGFQAMPREVYLREIEAAIQAPAAFPGT